jgi:hypothetical protein
MLTIGSDAHRKMFCDALVSTHRPFEPRDIQWPTLDASDVERLRLLPVWQDAVHSERTAAIRVRAMADVERDPLVREAIALQAYEEGRHAALVETLLAQYGIPIPDDVPEAPAPPEWGFLRMGYTECFDSFFAFGLFHMAAESGLFPGPLVQLFDGVMQEEARHIIFFSNWTAYRSIRLPWLQRPWFACRRAFALLLQTLDRARTAFTVMRTGGTDGFLQVPESIANVTVRTLARVCLAESDRRLARYDERLLRPRTVPGLVRFLLRILPAKPDEPAQR